MSMYTVLWQDRKLFVHRGGCDFLTEPVLIQTADSVGHCSGRNMCKHQLDGLEAWRVRGNNESVVLGFAFGENQVER